MIQVKNVTKKYRKKLAVDDVTFDVRPGRVTAFVGPNGAGKSTTMRAMLGLDSHEGLVTFDGKNLSEYIVPNQIVGALLEAKSFHPKRTARNHLLVLAAASGVSNKRVDEVLELVGLTGVANRKAGTFSLGMSQRLGIAAALLNDPKYLILDEPANGLDPEGIVWLREFLKAYAKSGKSVFISSHLLSEISQMADDLIVVGQGRIIQTTTVSDLTDKSGKTGIFVKGLESKKLKKALDSQKNTYTEVDGGYLVGTSTLEKIGKLAKKFDVTVIELTKREATLEEAFLQVTAASQEFKGQTEKAGKKWFKQ